MEGEVCTTCGGPLAEGDHNHAEAAPEAAAPADAAPAPEAAAPVDAAPAPEAGKPWWKFW